MGQHAYTEDWELDLDFEPKPTPQVRQESLSDAFFEDLTPGRTLTLPTSEYEEAPSNPLTIRPSGVPSEWPAQLPMALALDVEDQQSILDRFGLTEERFNLIRPLPAFRKALAEAHKSLRDSGHTFKLKCAGIAEEFLDQIYLDLYNPLVGLTTKIDIFKYLTKMGCLEPAPQKEMSGPATQAVQININLN